MKRSRIHKVGSAIFLCCVLIASPFARAADILPPGGQNAAAMAAAADAAKKAAMVQAAAQAASMIMGAVLLSQCSPQNPAACAMGALAMAQGASLGGTKMGSLDSASGFSTAPGGGSSGTPGSTGGETNGGNAGAGSGTTIGSVADINKQLAGKGASLSPDGKSMTLPNGTTIPLSAAGSMSSLSSAAGLTDGQIAAGNASLKEAQQAAMSKIKGVSMAAEGGGSGGARSGAGDGETGGRRGFDMNGWGKVPGAKREKPNLSGMTKNFGTDKIGVSADNIFEMISRRYQQKDTTNSFLKN